MGFKIQGPHIVAFLEFVSQQYPDAEGFSDLEPTEQREVVERFASLLPAGLSRSDYELEDVVRYGFVRIVEDGFSVVEPPKFARWLKRPGGEDALSRYKSAKYRAIFLYTEHDTEFIDSLRRSWIPFDRESGSLLHFFDYGLDGGIGKRRRPNSNPYTYAEDYIRGLAPIPGANISQIRKVGLPCCLVWDDQQNSYLVPFSDTQGASGVFRDRLRDMLRAAEFGEFHWAWDSMREFQEQPRVDCDVFVSYQHQDRSWAERLSESIEELGLRPWFDQHLRAGERWDSKIWNMINKAKQVFVVWSDRSIRSEYVLAEAHYARSQKKLVPIMSETEVDIPVPFNTVQALDLSDWSENEPAPRSIVDALRSV